MDEVLDCIPVAAIRLRGGAVVAANDAARLLLGPDLEGIVAMLHERDRADLLAAASEGDGARTVIEVRGAGDPPRRMFSVSLGPAPDGGTIAVFHETSELHRLDHAIAELATGVYTTDRHLAGQWMPRRLAEGLGLTPELFAGIDVYGLIHPDDVPRARALVDRAVAAPGVAYSSTLRIIHPAQLDAYYPIVVHVTWLPDDDVLGGLLVRFDTGGTDESSDVDAADELGTLTLRDATPQGFLNLSVTGDLLQRDSRAREILRPVSDDDRADWLSLLQPADRPVVDALLADARRGVLRPPVEVGFAGNGTTVWVRLEVIPYDGPSGDVVGTFVVLLDITTEYEARLALAEAKEQLWHQARHDALTGLPNRVPFFERLGELLDRAPSDDHDHRRRGDGADRRPAVLVCDLDGFKAINDRHGHRVGDLLLVQIARRLERSIRADDSVCRYGGDEFLVLCDDLGDDELDAFAARIVTNVCERVIIDGAIHQVGVSIGIARAAAGDDVDPDDLFRRADQAMYEAKSAGGRRVVVA